MNTYILEDELDFDNRDAPVIYNGDILIGNHGSTHATMVQEMIYGMDFETNHYDKLYNDEKKYTGINFFRYCIEDDDKYIYGHLINNYIYWDMYEYNCVKKKFIDKFKMDCINDSQHKHYALLNNTNLYCKMKDFNYNLLCGVQKQNNK